MTDGRGRMPGDWEVMRRQVALCGRVTRGDGVPVADVEVGIEPRAERGGVVRTRQDGLYFFLDLPDGEYTVATRDPRTGAGGEGRGRVSRDASGKVRAAVVDLKMSPRESRRPGRDGRPKQRG